MKLITAIVNKEDSKLSAPNWYATSSMSPAWPPPAAS